MAEIGSLLIIKIDGHNNYQIKQTARSYYQLVLSSHWYLKGITAAQIGLEPSTAILLLFFSLPKQLDVRRAISEESLVS